MRLQVYVDDALAAEIDDARGITPTSLWIKWALRRVLDEKAGRGEKSPPATVHQLRPVADQTVGAVPVPESPPEPAHAMPEGLRTHGGRRDVQRPD
jgi:hypothetical protein